MLSCEPEFWRKSCQAELSWWYSFYVSTSVNAGCNQVHRSFSQQIIWLESIRTRLHCQIADCSLSHIGVYFKGHLGILSSVWKKLDHLHPWCRPKRGFLKPFFLTPAKWFLCLNLNRKIENSTLTNVKFKRKETFNFAERPFANIYSGDWLVFVDYSICIRGVNGIFRYVSNCLKKMVYWN